MQKKTLADFAALILLVFALICLIMGLCSGKSPELYWAALGFLVLFLGWIGWTKHVTGEWFSNKSAGH